MRETERCVEPPARPGARVLRARAGRARLPRGRRAPRLRPLRRGSRPTTASCRRSATLGANLVPSGEGCAAFADAAAAAALEDDHRRGARGRTSSGPRPGARMPRAARGPARASPSTRSPSRRSRARPGCGRATLDDLERLLPACAAAHELELGVDPLAARRRGLPLAHPRADRRGPLVALARGRRDPLQGRGVRLDAGGRADPAGLGRPGGARPAATERAGCATSAGCCSRRRRS